MGKIKPSQILLLALAAGLIFVFGHISAILIYGKGNANILTGQINFPSSSNNQNLSTADLGIVSEIYQKLKANYLQTDFPDKQEFIDAAAKGMIDALDDQYTNYFTKAEWQEMQSDNSGQFEGVGIKLQEGNDYAVVEVPIVNSPAAKAGIKSRDSIIEVNSESTKGLSVTKVAQLIRGESGTQVKIKIFRSSTDETLEFTITRAKIDIASIEVNDLSDGGKQIVVSRFTESSFAEFQRQWQAAVSEVKGAKANYVILDLRNNTGGWVDAAKYILEEFLPRNTLIMREVDKTGSEEKVFTNREGDLQKIPLVVLVNEGSASASEITAGALQDNGRAKLVGKPTLGKGVEQTVQQTSDGGVLYIVFKKWLTPDGKNLSKADALKPDREVDLSIDDVKANKDPQLDAAKAMLK